MPRALPELHSWLRGARRCALRPDGQIECGRSVAEGGLSTGECDVAYSVADALPHYRSQLAAFLRARCRGHHAVGDVEDLLQELWLRCRTVDLQQVDDVKSYLFRAAHNLVIDQSRSAARRRVLEGSWSLAANLMQVTPERHLSTERRAGRVRSGHADVALSEPALAERGLLARETLLQIDEALRAVGERAALIFRRYRLEGVMQMAIATELGVSLSTVEKDLRKAYAAVLAFQESSDDE